VGGAADFFGRGAIFVLGPFAWWRGWTLFWGGGRGLRRRVGVEFVLPVGGSFGGGGFAGEWLVVGLLC